MLYKGCIGHGECAEDKAPCNTTNRSERYTNLAQPGIEKAVEDGQQKDKSKGVNVLHDVVRDAMELHCTS